MSLHILGLAIKGEHSDGFPIILRGTPTIEIDAADRVLLVLDGPQPLYGMRRTGELVQIGEWDPRTNTDTVDPTRHGQPPGTITFMHEDMLPMFEPRYPATCDQCQQPLPEAKRRWFWERHKR